MKIHWKEIPIEDGSIRREQLTEDGFYKGLDDYPLGLLLKKRNGEVVLSGHFYHSNGGNSDEFYYQLSEFTHYSLSLIELITKQFPELTDQFE